MSTRRILAAFVRVVAEEAEKNAEFDKRLREVFGIESSKKSAAQKSALSDQKEAGNKRSQSRRPPATLDPIHLARQGEAVLRAELGKLNLDQLLDVVAEYGMDTGKLVMKWRTPDRVIDRIVEVSVNRAQKGSAFRDQPPDETSN